MFPKFTHSVLALAALTSLFACAGAEGAGEDDGEDDVNVSEDELISFASRIAGTYTTESGNRPPTFKKLVLNRDRSFELDIDTGVRCPAPACNPFQHLVGTYRVTSRTLFLDHNAQRPSSTFYGAYPYKLSAAGKLTLTSRSNPGWTTTLKKDTSIIPKDVTKLAANASGGFVRPGPAGSQCISTLQQYSVDIATRRFSYTYCDSSNQNAPYRKITGSRTIAAADITRLIAAYNELKVKVNAPCGADKPFYTVDVTNPRGTKRYVDDFYSCQDPNATYVDNIDAPFTVYRSLLPARPISPREPVPVLNPVE